MSKILTMVLFNLLGKIVSEKFLNELVIKLISLSLQKLKQKQFFKDEEMEKRVDDIIDFVNDSISDKK